MPQPLNYMLDTAMPNPVGGFLQGIQLVQQLEQQKAAQQQAENRQKVLSNLAALGSNATADDYVKASLALPEDRELFKQNWDIIEPAKKDAVFNAGSDAYMLAQSGDTEGAKAKLEEWALGFENAGDKQNADKFRTAAKMMELHPESAKTTIAMMLAMADGERFKNAENKTAAVQNWEYFKEALGPEEAKRVIGADDDIITNLPNDGFYAGPRSGLAEVLKGLTGQGGAAAPLPTVTNEQEYNALPPGSAYTDPTGKRRFKPGGPTPLASGNFRP